MSHATIDGQSFGTYWNQTAQGQEWLSNQKDGSIYLDGSASQSGGTASGLVLTTNGALGSLGKNQTAYLEGGKGGYVNALATNGGSVANNGTIYLKGSTKFWEVDRVKGISVDEGRGVNAGTIVADNAHGMVANSKTSEKASIIINRGTIQVRGINAAGMLDNNPNPTVEDSLVNIKNKNRIEAYNGAAAIKVAADSKSGKTNITLEGGSSIDADESSKAVDVATSSHEVNLNFENGDVTIDGLVRIAGETNQTDINVRDAKVDNLALDASHIREVNLDQGSLNIASNQQDRLTVEDMSLANNSSFTIDEGNEDLTVVVNDLEKDATSKVDFGDANVDLNQDWTVEEGDNFTASNLVYDDNEQTNLTFTNKGTVEVSNSITIGNDTFNNEYSSDLVDNDGDGRYDDVIEHIGSVKTDSLILKSGATFNNKGNLEVGSSTTIDAAKLVNEGIAQSGSELSLKNGSHLTNSSSLTTRWINVVDSGITNNYGGLYTDYLSIYNGSLDNSHYGKVHVKYQFDLSKGEITNQGEFTVRGLTWLRQNTTLVNDRDMNLANAKLSAGSKLENTAGSNLTIGTLTASGEGASITNLHNEAGYGKLTAESVSLTDGASLINDGGDMLINQGEYSSTTADASTIQNINGIANFGNELTLKNGSHLTNSGSLTTRWINVVDSGITNNYGGLYTDYLSIYNGSLDNSHYGKVHVKYQFDLSKGEITNQGEFTVGGVTWLRENTTLVNDRDMGLSSLKLADNSTVKNTLGSVLTVDQILAAEHEDSITGTIVNQGDLTIAQKENINGIHFVQSGTGAELTMSSGAWFNNSRIELVNGAGFDRTGQSLGVGNNYVLGSSSDLGSDEILQDDWSAGFSRLVADQVDGTNQFTLNKGGLLVATEIGTFDDNSGKINFNGGALETSLDQIFSEVSYKDPVTGSVITGDLVGEEIASNHVETIRDNIVNGITVGKEGGHLVFNDSLISNDTVDSVDETLAWDGLTVHFTGELADSQLTDDDWANRVIAGLDHDVVLSSVDLIANSEVNGTEGPFNATETDTGIVLEMNGGSFGVGTVVNTELVQLSEGAHFTLVGKGEGQSLVGDNGSVQVKGQSELTLGWGAGKLNTVDLSESSKLTIEGGNYLVGTIDATGSSISINAGLLQTETLNLSISGLTNEGALSIDGKATVDKLSALRNTASGFLTGSSLVVEAQGVENGTYVNEGKASWTSAEIKGDAQNSGYEEITNYVLGNSGEQDNSGTQVIVSATIDGTYHNHSEGTLLQNNKNSLMAINGTFVNEGTAVLGKVSGSGQIDNQNYLYAQSMEGNDSMSFSNAKAGEAVIVADATLGKLTNSGSMAVGGNLTAVTTTNNGKLDVFGSLNVATLDNQDELTVLGNATVGSAVNSGSVTMAGTLTTNETFKNDGSVLVETAHLNGTFTQSVAEASFTALGGDNVISGQVNVSDGTFGLGSTTVESGAVVNATDNGSVSMHLAKDTVMAGRINVDGASVVLGQSDSLSTLANHNEPQYPHDSDLTAAQNPILLGNTGVIAVGEGAADQQLSGGSVWFGADSLLTINTALYEGSGLFQGEGSFTVEEGSQIQVNESTLGWGTYKISEGFESTDASGWYDHSHVSYAGDKDVDLIVQEDENGDIVLTVGSNNITDKLPDVAIPNIVNEVISDADRNTQEAGVKGFLAGAIENGILAETMQADTINNVSQIMAAGGVLVQGMTLVENVNDMVERHLSYEDVHFQNGKLQSWDGVRLWANALGQHIGGSDYDFTGASTDIDGYNTGFIFGADLAMTNGFRYGAAFAYQNANVDSNGSVVSTSNDADAYSFSLYGAKTFGLFNIIGTASYTRVNSDLEQTLPGQLGALHGKHTMDVQNDIWSVGVKGEMYVDLTNTMALVPYVGVRAVSMKTDTSSSHLGGSKAFRYDTDTATQVQFPMGVTLQASTDVSGWTTRGLVDVSITPVAGDKDVDTAITAFGLNARDITTTEFSDDITGAIRIGGSAEKDNFSFGGNVGVSTGGSRDANVTFGLNARYRF